MAQSVSKPSVNAPNPPRVRVNTGGMSRAWLVDWLFKNLTLLFALTTILLILSIAYMLYRESLLHLHHSGAGFYTGKVWDPVAPDEGKPTGSLFGALPFIYGTLLTSF